MSAPRPRVERESFVRQPARHLEIPAAQPDLGQRRAGRRRSRLELQHTRFQLFRARPVASGIRRLAEQEEKARVVREEAERGFNRVFRRREPAGGELRDGEAERDGGVRRLTLDRAGQHPRRLRELLLLQVERPERRLGVDDLRIGRQDRA